MVCIHMVTMHQPVWRLQPTSLWHVMLQMLLKQGPVKDAGEVNDQAGRRLFVLILHMITQ